MKALALLSGGLDSVLATKLVLDQNIKVIGVHFSLPFSPDSCAEKAAKKLKIPFIEVKTGMDYLKIIKNPKHGYGAGLNPCIDCRIFVLKKAKNLMKRFKAKFIITGEVVDQRPMSQHMKALRTIDKEAKLEGLVLRPLSAKLLSETIPEKKKWVDRKKLLDIRGKSRSSQLKLAKKFRIRDYKNPAGGCLLTNKEFANKLNDLLGRSITRDDIELLKIGRHFRAGRSRIIVGRNEEENRMLAKKKEKDYIFEVPDYGSPVTLLKGCKSRKAIITAAKLTALYSDCNKQTVVVNYGKKLKKSITVKQMRKKEAARMNLALNQIVL